MKQGVLEPLSREKKRIMIEQTNTDSYLQWIIVAWEPSNF